MSGTKKTYDFLIVGAGIFGVCTALELIKQNFRVGIINSDTIPHPLAASTDISKIVRMEYGSDGEYMDMAIACINAWKEYNDILEEKIYHEVGYLVLSRNSLQDKECYEGASLENLHSRGFKPDILTVDDIADRFPSFNASSFSGGFFHKNGGYAYSGRAVELLLSYAQSQGVSVYSGYTVSELRREGHQVKSINTSQGRSFQADHTIICAGNFSPYLIPELKPYMKITGHPVFHIRPSNASLYKVPRSAAFAADISGTGWYGFPFHPVGGVVKVANHSIGLELDPNTDPRIVNEQDFANLRSFLESSIPALLNDDIVYTRRCCYTDTLDGHFWIDRHPELENLTVGTGGSGHGFKMGPEAGKMIALTAMGNSHRWSDRYKWRNLNTSTVQKEEARSKNN